MQEARIRENTYLFQNFEAVLPTCHECYVHSNAEAEATAEYARGAVHTAPRRESLWRIIWFSRYISVMDFWTRRIEPAAAKRLLDENRGIALDVTRTLQTIKIRGAVRPNPQTLSGWLLAVQEGKDVITYCT